MRATFHAQLDALGEHGAVFCGQVGGLLEEATRSLLEASLDGAAKVTGQSGALDQMQSDTEHAAVTLLALQSPVASDLRRVVTALWIVGDLHRMGALAMHVAAATQRSHPTELLPDTLRPVFVRMGQIGVDLAQQAALVLRHGDTDLARSMDGSDDEMDRLHQQVFTVLDDPSWRYGVATAADIALLAHFYERFADHAVVVGRRAIYLVTGENVGGDHT